MPVTGPTGMTYISIIQLQDHVHPALAHLLSASEDSLCRSFRTTLPFVAYEYILTESK